MSCTNWFNDSIGPLGIDYLYFYQCQCQSPALQIIASWVIIMWVVYLISIVGTTASNYFSPTLSTICEKLSIRYDIAGITFLAFGNGAPDVFSSISSFSGSANISIGIGALLGGSVFVTSIVVGSIALISPSEVCPNFFIRDVIFHMTAISSLTLVGFLGYVSLWIGLLLFFIYGVYVAIVLTSSASSRGKGQNNNSGSSNVNTDSNNNNNILNNGIRSSGVVFSAIQTAFWHPSASSKKKHRRFQQLSQNNHDYDYEYESFDRRFDDENNENNNDDSQNGSGISSIEMNSIEKGYKFLTLHDNSLNGGYNSINHGNQHQNQHQNGNQQNGENEDITIDLFGGMNSSEFEGTIVEDYIPNHASNSDIRMLSNNTNNRISISNPIDSSMNPVYSVNHISPLNDIKSVNKQPIQHFEIDTGSNSLTTKLLPDEDVDRIDSSSSFHNPYSSYDSYNNNNNLYHLHHPKLRKNSSQYVNTLAMFYWQQQAMTNRIRKTLFSTHEEWLELSIYRRIWIILESPIVFARDITIPTLDSNNWNKYYAIIQPIASSLFLNFLFGYTNGYVHHSHLPMPLLWFLTSIPFSILIYLLTHFNKPPSDMLLVTIWNIWAFIMSIAWIYTLSKELVVCLGSMGIALNISSGFLGLTVLAWGNSIGDLISNTAIAKQGLGEMALAGCYGGPVFNILIGLGLSFTYVCYTSYPIVYDIRLDISSIVSIVFLYFSLSSTLLIVWWRRFKLDRILGIFLISLYVCYTACQLILLSFTNVHDGSID